MKNCGHMFREKLPFSDLWEELHKVAILKRKVRELLPACIQKMHGTDSCLNNGSLHLHLPVANSPQSQIRLSLMLPHSECSFCVPQTLVADHAAATPVQHAHPLSLSTALQADAQIYNKVLALMEDWADAINLPAYRQEYNNLKVRSGGACCNGMLARQ